jgi:hypothetical protein
VRELVADDRRDSREVQAAEQLIDLVGHSSVSAHLKPRKSGRSSPPLLTSNL